MVKQGTDLDNSDSNLWNKFTAYFRGSRELNKYPEIKNALRNALKIGKGGISVEEANQLSGSRLHPNKYKITSVLSEVIKDASPEQESFLLKQTEKEAGKGSTVPAFIAGISRVLIACRRSEDTEKSLMFQDATEYLQSAQTYHEAIQSCTLAAVFAPEADFSRLQVKARQLIQLRREEEERIGLPKYEGLRSYDMLDTLSKVGGGLSKLGMSIQTIQKFNEYYQNFHNE